MKYFLWLISTKYCYFIAVITISYYWRDAETAQELGQALEQGLSIDWGQVQKQGQSLVPKRGIALTETGIGDGTCILLEIGPLAAH
jgi:hypothetical protein